jgi:alpha-glucosidase (family GH31 glycosyl hydrolase)
MLGVLYEKIQFAGIWLDMNEYANFCNGPCSTPPPYNHSFDFTYDLPYHPGVDRV